MAYCTEAQIESEFKSVDFTATSAVTTTDISRFIAEADAYIDGKLYTRYSTPITGASALILVRMISIFLVASRVSKILELKTGEADKNQLVIDQNKKTAEQMLKDIVEGNLLLADATLRNSANGVFDYNYSNDIEQTVNVTADQW